MHLYLNLLPLSSNGGLKDRSLDQLFLAAQSNMCYSSMGKLINVLKPVSSSQLSQQLLCYRDKILQGLLSNPSPGGPAVSKSLL